MKSFGLAALLVTAGVALPAFGAECSLIEVEAWAAELVPDNSQAPLKITGTLVNSGDKAFRMVDGGTTFTDALDRRIIAIAIDPDLTLAPGERADFEGFYLGGESERLATLPPSDVNAEACVRSILYEDGTKVEF